MEFKALIEPIVEPENIAEPMIVKVKKEPIFDEENNEEQGKETNQYIQEIKLENPNSGSEEEKELQNNMSAESIEDELLKDSVKKEECIFAWPDDQYESSCSSYQADFKNEICTVPEYKLRRYRNISNEERSYKRARGPVRQPGRPIRQLSKNSVASKDGRAIWHASPPQGVEDILDAQTITPGCPTNRVSDAKTPLELFTAFMPDTLLLGIVTHTNIKICQLRQTIGDHNRDNATYSDTNLTELKCFIGCLIMSGVRKDNHLRSEHMFSSIYGCMFYKTLFSQKRFDFLISALCFDDQASREARMRDDRFAQVRDVWEAVIANCRANYKAGPIVTVDYQFLSYRGQCIFRMFIPNKPAKYGLKLFMVCDADSLYCLDALPYLGKDCVPDNIVVNQGQYFTIQLLKHLMEEGRVVCCDNWFTSLPLARALLQRGMHLVGTISPKPYLPTQVIKDENLPLKESVAVYNHESRVNVVYKRLKPQKFVAIMTTIHNSFSNVEENKTEAHMFYNASKGGVDGFNKMCAASSTRRKTKRWPMCIFYGLLNIVMNNAWIIYESCEGKRGKDRCDFIMDMAYHLARPWALDRYQSRAQFLTLSLREHLKSTFNLGELLGEHPQAPAQAKAPAQAQASAQIDHPLCPGRILADKRQRCRFCPSDSHWRGKPICNGEGCAKFVCNNHSVVLCQDCWLRNQR